LIENPTELEKEKIRNGIISIKSKDIDRRSTYDIAYDLFDLMEVKLESRTSFFDIIKGYSLSHDLDEKKVKKIIENILNLRRV